MRLIPVPKYTEKGGKIRQRYDDRGWGLLARELKHLPNSPCAWGEAATRLVYDRLGAGGGKIPAAAHGDFWIDGWNVVVRRSAAPQLRHRVFVRYDGRMIPVGRVRQALCSRSLRASRHRAKRMRGYDGRFTRVEGKSPPVFPEW